jgi:predicted glycosyltransferase
MPAGGEREASLTADYNAEMVEQIARYPRVRDRAIFIGEPDDIVPGTFGPGLPEIRGWTERHFSFAGYVTGFDPVTLGDRERLRAELGYGPDDCVCVVSVGGSGIGEDLLRRVIAAFSATKQLVPALRMVAVAGPRIDPARLPTAPEIDVLPYVHDLYRHLAACDVAVVQGGLATTMELTASRRPFIYVPLERHFEQNLHVARRLDRYRAGRRMHLEETTPDALATAIAQELSRELEYLPVAADGAAHAAAMIAELL